MIYYISDTHFGDERIMKLSKRPFLDVDEMNNVLIEKWNDKVSDCDDVYIVGDFALNDQTANAALNGLNGRLHLIICNHDNLSEETLKRFSTVSQILTINDSGRSVSLCHYPLLSYENSIYGGYHIFGHIHNNTADIAYKITENIPHIYNCGVDVNDFAPQTLDELKNRKNDK